MKYYDRNGREFKYTLFKNIGCGKQGYVSLVHEDNNICLKKYNLSINLGDIYSDLNITYSQDMFDYLKTYEKGFSQLHDLLYDSEIKRVVGYTAKYYSDIVENILDISIEYLLDNFNIMYELIEKLAHDMVRVVDLHSENILLTKDDMRIIDMDKYQFDRDNRLQVILEINRMALYYAFKGIFIKELKRKNMLSKENLAIVNNLFSYGTTPLGLKVKTLGKDKFSNLLK